MEVLMMSGAYAGEIRDIKPIYARQMIADGRAVDPNAPIAEPESAMDAPVQVIVIDPPKPTNKRAGKRWG